MDLLFSMMTQDVSTGKKSQSIIIFDCLVKNSQASFIAAPLDAMDHSFGLLLGTCSCSTCSAGPMEQHSEIRLAH